MTSYSYDNKPSMEEPMPLSISGKKLGESWIDDDSSRGIYNSNIGNGDGNDCNLQQPLWSKDITKNNNNNSHSYSDSASFSRDCANSSNINDTDKDYSVYSTIPGSSDKNSQHPQQQHQYYGEGNRWHDPTPGYDYREDECRNQEQSNQEATTNTNVSVCALHQYIDHDKHGTYKPDNKLKQERENHPANSVGTISLTNSSYSSGDFNLDALFDYGADYNHCQQQQEQLSRKQNICNGNRNRIHKKSTSPAYSNSSHSLYDYGGIYDNNYKRENKKEYAAAAFIMNRDNKIKQKQERIRNNERLKRDTENSETKDGIFWDGLVEAVIHAGSTVFSVVENPCAGAEFV